MIGRVLAAGLLAGLIAGLSVAAIQHISTTPLIVAAEVFETAQRHSDRLGEVAATITPAASGLSRLIGTSIATMLVSIGYALILLAAMLAVGDPIKPRRAALWGLCAFIATGLATGLGLAPQLPGAAETDLAGRQIWWIATAVTTSAGLFAMTRYESWPALLLGIVLLAAPHFATPQPAAPESTVPAEIAARFAAASLAVQALDWVLAGVLAAALYNLLQRESEEAEL
jgi:cobalt transporter subunit CbtA